MEQGVAVGVGLCLFIAVLVSLKSKKQDKRK